MWTYYDPLREGRELGVWLSTQWIQYWRKAMHWIKCSAHPAYHLEWKQTLILRINIFSGFWGKEWQGLKKKKSQEKVWSIDWEGRQMPLVVSSEFSGFELSEWVIQWSRSINEKAVPLGTIHTVHDYFMGVGGNSLLPFDSMVLEWTQNHWMNQGKQCATLPSCPSVFHRLICTAWDKEGKILSLQIYSGKAATI